MPGERTEMRHVREVLRLRTAGVSGNQIARRLNLAPSTAALLPLSDDGVAIDHVLGAANHRTLLADEPTMTRVVRKRRI